MNFDFTETQQMIRETARKFAEEELAPDSIERDEKEEFPHGGIKKLGELGFMGMMVPEEYGGAGLDMVSYILALEEISRVDASAGVIMSVNNSLVCFGLNEWGNDFQKEKYLKPLASGNALGAFALSEPEAGSDASNQRTTATRAGEHYLLNGTKNWITNGSNADYDLDGHDRPRAGVARDQYVHRGKGDTGVFHREKREKAGDTQFRHGLALVPGLPRPRREQGGG